MTKRGLSLCSAAVLAGVVLVAGHVRAADTYDVDPVHSSLLFKVKHANVSYTFGRINGPTGTITFDEGDPAKSSVSVEAKAESVDTGNEKRDQHLKGPDFFNAKQFPTLSFKSKSIKKLDDTTFEVTGDFTMLGVSKELTIKLTKTGGGKAPWGPTLIGFEGAFTIKRSDFGMKQALDMIGDDIAITMAFEGSKK